MARLPVPGQDNNAWGDILNEYLSVSIDADGKLLTSAVTEALPSPIPTAKLGGGTASVSNFLRGDGVWAVPNGAAAVATETDRAEAAEALLAPLASPTFTGTVTVPTPSNATDASTKAYVDTAARTGIYAVTVQTGNYSATTNDQVILANASSAAMTITLPSGAVTGKVYQIKKTDNSIHTVTITPTSAQIDGTSSAIIKVQYASVTCVMSGGNWSII